MKIGFYVPSWPPGSKRSGIVTYASQLTPALRRLGHEIFVVTNSESDHNTDPHTIDLRNFDSPPSLLTRAMFKFAYPTTGFKIVAAPIVAAIKNLVEEHSLDVFEMEESGGWSYAVS